MRCAQNHLYPDGLYFCPLCAGKACEIIGRMNRPKSSRSLRNLLKPLYEKAGLQFPEFEINGFFDGMEEPRKEPVTQAKVEQPKTQTAG
jgi:hypothetical protein